MTSAAVDRTTGEVAGIGHSGDLGATPGELEDVLPKQSVEPWQVYNCAEVAACAAAVSAGSLLENLVVVTVRTIIEDLTEDVVAPCGNCQAWLPGR